MVAAFVFLSLAMPFVALRWRALFQLKTKECWFWLYDWNLSVAFVCNWLYLDQLVRWSLLPMVHKNMGFQCLCLCYLDFKSYFGAIQCLYHKWVGFLISPFDNFEEWKNALFYTAVMLVACSISLLWVAYRPKFFKNCFIVFHIRFLQIYRTLQTLLYSSSKTYLLENEPM